VFDAQQQFLDAFAAGELTDDAVIVVRFQGPRANGMPELHRLTPALGVMQGRGQRVALITDGRMSGASGKVPAVIHCTPEAADGGPLARLRNGDVIQIDTLSGRFEVLGVELGERELAAAPSVAEEGTGRELFRLFRNAVSSADSGATIFDTLDPAQPSAVPPSTRSPIREYAL
jgi:phosphogluconate dehydratase